jgi:hypothetical protein
MLAGYAVGIFLVLERITRRFVVIGQEQLHSLLDFAYFHGELWAQYLYGNLWDLYAWIAILVALSVVTLTATSLARLAPLSLAPGQLTCAPVPTRTQLRQRWRAAVIRSSPRCAGAAAAGAFGGFAIAMLAESCALGRIALMSIWPGVWVPTPLWSLQSVDAVALVLFATVCPVVSTVIIARRRFRRDPVVLRNWCPACGHPQPAATLPGPSHAELASHLAAAPCTECGAVRNPPPPAARHRRLLQLALLIVAISLGMHIVAPSVYMRLFVPPQTTDTAVVPAGALVMVQLPREHLWLRMEPSSTADASDVRLHIDLREIAGSTEPLHLVLTPDATSTTLELRGDRKLDINATWTTDYRVVYVYLSRGATSIRAVDPRDAPPAQ